MPGLTGIIRFASHEQVDQDLDSMLGVMRYNNRYSHGRFIDKECGLRIGWTCHPGSFAEGMPLVSEDGNTVMIFAGEDFGDRDAIARQRHAISSKDSAEAGYLLGLYAELGDQFFAQLNGWFSGVIVDRRSKRVTLFNDRYGMGRIYYHAGPDEFLFASEAKALLKIRPALRVIEPEILAEYLRYSCVCGESTLSNGISFLPNVSACAFQ